MNVIYSSNLYDAAHRVSSAVDQLASEHEQILWLLSGGSNIETAVHAAETITHSNISVSLIDERYGAVGHSDSNWQQLTIEGFPFERFHSHSVLVDETPELTVDNFAKLLAAYPHSIALLGMGADGHVSGILPHSPAGEVDDKDVITYLGHDFTRITTTPKYITSLNRAILVVMGKGKHEQLRRFLNEDIDPREQPVQLLKHVKHLTIITDMEKP